MLWKSPKLHGNCCLIYCTSLEKLLELLRSTRLSFPPHRCHLQELGGMFGFILYLGQRSGRRFVVCTCRKCLFSLSAGLHPVWPSLSQRSTMDANRSTPRGPDLSTSSLTKLLLFFFFFMLFLNKKSLQNLCHQNITVFVSNTVAYSLFLST